MLAACGGGESGENISEADLVDMTKGPADAPVVLVEYASSVCPACANYNATMKETINALTEDGKLRFIFREFPSTQVDVAGFSVARCAGADKYFDVLDDLFTNQRGLLAAARNGTVRAGLKTIAARHGLDEAAFEACLKNDDIQQDIRNAALFGDTQGVNETPTLFLNGIKLENPDGRSPESLITLVEEFQ